MLRGGEQEDDYGIDLMTLIGSVSTKSDAAALPGRIQAELLKDERIQAVEVEVAMTYTGPIQEFAVEISATTNEGPFTLQLLASEVTVELLGFTAEEG